MIGFNSTVAAGALLLGSISCFVSGNLNRREVSNSLFKFSGRFVLGALFGGVATCAVCCLQNKLWQVPMEEHNWASVAAGTLLAAGAQLMTLSQPRDWPFDKTRMNKMIG